MFDLTGKVALVTGAGGGLGKVISRLYHAQGATVVLADIMPEGIEELKAELGERAHTVVGNLTDPEAPQFFIKKPKKKPAPRLISL